MPLAAAALFGGSAHAAEREKPNTLVLFDDLGWGQPQSSAPGSALRTPNLDKLAAARDAVH